jgi:tetratricopeptide (TPR) repeat protein
MFRLCALFCCLLPVLLAAASSSWSGASLEEGIELYQRNLLKEALPHFETAVEDEKENPLAHAYLAETLRRLDRKKEAVEHARKALAIDTCHSFAHTVIADASNPMFGIWDGANEDSVWAHLLKATECNPKDGNAWTGVWVEAMERGEHALEVRAARQMIDGGFLAPPILAYNRWVLSNLPENAVLLTNGDMDTYPAVALQEVEKLRRDVCVVNFSLLNVPWYALLVAERYDLPLPCAPAEIRKFRAYKDEKGSLVTRSKNIVASWIDLQKKGKFRRPLALAATLFELDLTPDCRSRLKLAGPFYICYPESVESSEDETMMRAALGEVNPDDFKGSWVSSIDRSPVRRVGTGRVGSNITALAVRYGHLLLDSGSRDEALVWADWAEEFDRGMEVGPLMADEIAELRKKIAGEED